MKQLILTLMLLSMAIVSFAQSKIDGKIVSSSGEPLIGVNVYEKGTTNGTITDMDGVFHITAKDGSIICASYIGFITAEMPATPGKTMMITLEEDNKEIDQVVVIGYGTQRKGDVTSAVASVKAEDFADGKISDAAGLIKGKVAGLSITNSSGDPTASSSIMLRGITTITGSVSPLILIDGVEGSLNDVAPENIASIDVLKDASAAAIYGTRGANGVIIITTKTGHREQKLTTTYNGYVSFSQWAKKSDFMDALDIAYGRTTFDYEGYDTDWLGEITNDSPIAQNHSISVSGGSEKSTYAGNITYTNDNGMIKNSDNENIKLQMDITHYAMKDILKFNFNTLVRQQKYDANNNSFVYRQAIIRNPTSPIYDEDGSYNENFNKLYYYNPVEMLNEFEGDTRYNSIRMTGNVTVEPIKGWQTNLMLSRTQDNSVYESFTHHDYYSLVRTDQNGSASKSEGGSKSDNLEITSKYDTNFGKLRFNALVGYSYLYNVYDGFNASNDNFPSEAYLYNSLGQGTYMTDKDHLATRVGSYKNDNKLIGFFGRLSLAYDNKYNLLVSVRQEGSSKFGADHKWGTFPSVSAGWTISNEKFMEGVDKVSNLKLRVGYGVTGVIPSESYLSQTLYTYDSYGDVLSMDGTSWVKSLQATQNPNPDLKWETTHEVNIGLDYGFLNDRITGTFDYYIKTTKDLLYYYNVPVPPNLYSSTLYNVGEMENKGYELMIEGKAIQKTNFSWTTTLTLSGYKNKLKSLSNETYVTDNFVEEGGLGEPISVATHYMEVGSPLGEFWGLKSVGVDKDGFYLVEVWDATANEWTVKQFNTNLNVQANRQKLGSGLPKMYLGWCNTFNYKDFDLTLQFTGQFGYKILNAQRCFYENNSSSYNRLKSASDTYPAVSYNKETKELEPVLDENGNQVMVTLSKSMSQCFVSDHLEKGDFLKLTNVTLGYRIPLKGNVAQYISGARVYVSASNIFCLTGYSGIDPEVENYFLAPGIDYQDKYPTTRSVSVGLSLNF